MKKIKNKIYSDYQTEYERDLEAKIVIWSFIAICLILFVIIPTACAKPDENGNLYLWGKIPVNYMQSEVDNYTYAIQNNIPVYYNDTPIRLDQYAIEHFDILLSSDGSKAILVDKK